MFCRRLRVRIAAVASVYADVKRIKIGQRLGRYQIEALLGSGGMGIVYLAQDPRTNRRVAIKLLDPARSTMDSAQLLLQEARTAARLNHPSICAVREIGRAGAEPFIVMEHVAGVPLGTVIPKERGLAVEVAARYTAEIVDALAYAHGEGVVHGDLKSANIMVAAGGVKVLDFGLAVLRPKSSDSDVDTTRTRESSSACGTVPYMAPELLRGQRADTRSDVWALGIVMFEMLAGRRPFRGATPYEAAAAILADSRVPLPCSVPPPFQSVVSRCLCVDRTARYPSAIELADAIRAEWVSGPAGKKAPVSV